MVTQHRNAASPRIANTALAFQPNTVRFSPAGQWVAVAAPLSGGARKKATASGAINAN